MTASKKVRHIIRFRILSLFLFLSLTTGTGKGDTPKRILLCEGTRLRASLLIRGSKAGPSEGFNSRLRVLELRAHYWSVVRRPLSYNRDRERGYPERDPSPRRKRAPSPPTDRRFEGRPLGGVQQPPQSARAPRPLLVRGSKAGLPGRVQRPPQATRAPRPLLIRGS